MRTLTLLAGLATAALSAVPAANNVVTQPIATTALQQQAIRDYWTPDRIRNMPTGPSAGQPPADTPTGATWTGDDTVAKTVGRLFFTSHGEDASCTATLVPSANRSTIVTAGHCVHSFDLIGKHPQWSANLYFVPGFRDNTMPYGGFVPRLAMADRHWVDDDQQDAYDQAFLVLNPGTDGRTAQDTTGAAQQIGFDAAGTGPVREFGYPRAAGEPGHQGRPEFTGQRVAQCWGAAVADPGSPAFPKPPKDFYGIPCDMGGGSSGGPRLTGVDGERGAGTVVGVDTQGFAIDGAGRGCDPGDQNPACVRHLGGPQFTAAITGPLYHAAAGS